MRDPGGHGEPTVMTCGRFCRHTYLLAKSVTIAGLASQTALSPIPSMVPDHPATDFPAGAYRATYPYIARSGHAYRPPIGARQPAAPAHLLPNCYDLLRDNQRWQA